MASKSKWIKLTNTHVGKSVPVSISSYSDYYYRFFLYFTGTLFRDMIRYTRRSKRVLNLTNKLVQFFFVFRYDGIPYFCLCFSLCTGQLRVVNLGPKGDFLPEGPDHVCRNETGEHCFVAGWCPLPTGWVGVSIM